MIQRSKMLTTWNLISQLTIILKCECPGNIHIGLVTGTTEISEEITLKSY